MNLLIYSPQSNLLLNPFSEIFNLVIVFFSSKISIWFFLIFYLCYKSYFIQYHFPKLVKVFWDTDSQTPLMKILIQIVWSGASETIFLKDPPRWFRCTCRFGNHFQWKDYLKPLPLPSFLQDATICLPVLSLCIIWGLLKPFCLQEAFLD